MTHKKKNDLIIPLLTVAADIAAIEISFLFSYWFRFHPSFTELFPVTSGIPPVSAYFQGSLFVIPVWLWLLKNRGLYRPRRITSFSDEFFVVVRIVVIGMLIVMGVAFFYRTFSFSRLIFLIIGFTSIVFISAGRLAVLKFERWWYIKGHDLKSVLIVGTSPVSNKIYKALAENRSLGYKLVGYCSVRNKRASSLSHLPFLGSIDSVPDLIRTKHIDVVLIALNENEQSHLPDMIRNCQGLNAELMMVPDILELMTSLVQIRHIQGIPFLGIKSPALSAWNSINKRIFDIVFASCTLILTSPIFALVALLIKIDSKGPVFYRQERIGIDGKTFEVIKFRSMRTDAELATGPVWSKRGDPRATRVGRILRRFSLDELPQFINVFRGDMSVVGPRPERSFFVEKFRKQIPRYLERHMVKTGLTGWAQVNGLRGNAPITERTKYDIYYVENWSLVFDLKIILKTIRAVLFGKDAY